MLKKKTKTTVSGVRSATLHRQARSPPELTPRAPTPPLPTRTPHSGLTNSGATANDSTASSAVRRGINGLKNKVSVISLEKEIGQRGARSPRPALQHAGRRCRRAPAGPRKRAGVASLRLPLPPGAALRPGRRRPAQGKGQSQRTVCRGHEAAPARGSGPTAGSHCSPARSPAASVLTGNPRSESGPGAAATDLARTRGPRRERPRGREWLGRPPVTLPGRSRGGSKHMNRSCGRENIRCISEPRGPDSYT